MGALVKRSLAAGTSPDRILMCIIVRVAVFYAHCRDTYMRNAYTAVGQYIVSVGGHVMPAHSVNMKSELLQTHIRRRLEAIFTVN